MDVDAVLARREPLDVDVDVDDPRASSARLDRADGGSVDVDEVAWARVAPPPAGHARDGGRHRQDRAARPEPGQALRSRTVMAYPSVPRNKIHRMSIYRDAIYTHGAVGVKSRVRQAGSDPAGHRASTTVPDVTTSPRLSGAADLIPAPSGNRPRPEVVALAGRSTLPHAGGAVHLHARRGAAVDDAPDEHRRAERAPPAASTWWLGRGDPPPGEAR